MSILTINLVLSTLVFWIAARIYVLPRLDELRPRTVLLPILLLHAFRHLRLMFLAPVGGRLCGSPSASRNTTKEGVMFRRRLLRPTIRSR
jgi:hypothetical protein